MRQYIDFFLEQKIDKPIGIVSKKVVATIANLYNFTTTKDMLRVDLKTDDINEIKKIINSINNVKFLSEILPSITNKKLYNASNTYKSYLFSLKNDCEYGKKDDVGIIINLYKETKASTKNGQSALQIVKKQLTPESLGIAKQGQLNLSSLNKAVVSGIKSTKLSNQVKDTIIDFYNGIIDGIDGIIKKPKDGIVDFKSTSDSITLNEALFNKLSKLNDEDVAKIGVDFGEILGAGYLLKKFDANNVEFPIESNFKLVDFFIDGQPVSSKYKEGSAPSVSSLYKQINDNPKIKQKIEKMPGGNVLLQVIATTVEKVSGYNILLCHDILNTRFAKFLRKNNLLTNDAKETLSLVNDFIRHQKRTTLHEICQNFLDGRTAADKTISDLLSDKQNDAAGILIGPATFSLLDALNNNAEISAALSKLVQSLKIKQLHLYIEVNRKIVKFELKSFDVSNFKFAFGGGAKEYRRVKIGFKIV